MSHHRSPVSRAACWAVGLVALGAALAPQASAATAFSPIGAFLESGPDGATYHLRDVAVDHATGVVVELKPVGGPVTYQVSPQGEGSYLVGFGTNEVLAPYSVAIDQSDGDVYISDPGSSQILRYANDRLPSPTFTRLSYPSPALGDDPGEIGDFAAPLAVDPTTGDLLVADPADDLVQRYDSTGTFLGSFDGSGSASAFTGLQDIAVDSTGDVIVVDSDGGDPASPGVVSRVERFSSAGVWEETIGPVDGAANVAVRPFNDEVAVSGNQDAVHDDSVPTLFMFDASSNVQLDVPSSLIHSTVSSIAFDDGPNGRMFVGTDVSRGLYPGAYGLVSIQVYGPPAAPVIEPGAADRTPWRATLTGTIRPGNLETTYRFEYGTTAAYGSQTPDTVAGSGSSPITVSSEITDLEPSTTYHYRLVAQNSLGTVEGPDQTFTTPDSPATAAVLDATGVGTSVATVNGAVNTHGHAGSYRFFVAQADGPYRWTSAPAPLAGAEAEQNVGVALSGLAPSTTYTVRLEVTTSGGVVSTGRREFTTIALPLRHFANPAALTLPPFPAVDVDPPSSDSGSFAAAVKGRSLRIEVPARGTVTVRGAGIRRVVRRPSGEGRTTVRLVLTKAGRRALARSKSGRLRRKVTIAYRPASGSPRSVTRTVTFAR